MPTYAYRLVNVFTRPGIALSGNPLCVFEGGQGLDTATMQALALQFNLSETTFILPAQHGASARVRIFTPTFEMPFAGHPTLGTAHVCRALGMGGDRLTLEMTAGIITVRSSGSRWTLLARAPHYRELTEPPFVLASLLGVEKEDIGERPLWVDTGSEQLLVPLRSEAAVRRVRVRADLLEQLRNRDGQAMVYVFASAGGALLARFFFPHGASVSEDPATGSAAANLGGWYLATGRSLPCEVEIAQGEYTGRGSSLRLQVDAARQIHVSGEVVDIGRGSIHL
ncbi:MAG: PhzF family phenazine biosynthesis protein [Gammaproteobacteria bacterium]|nr:PhzF family phenazine biosynthesis protein [Gammaproteobacteria bacterium]MBV9696331.1 PhzF family phenazine biosynthesis protein [Gammaproteobacteria bacterium]